MIKRIISGFQNGVDLSAIWAANLVDIETGGQMPKGFKNLDGLHPEFKEKFGATENESSDYPPRTRFNVKNSDATVCIAKDWSSPGEILTKKLIKEYKKPAVYINFDDQDYGKLIRFIEKHSIEILNVAGNSKKTCPEISGYAFKYLVNVFMNMGLSINNNKEKPWMKPFLYEN